MYKKISVIASAIIWILLPKCSACLMAYMGLFSALGLGHLVNHPYTLSIIKILLAVNFVASLYLAIKAKQYLYAVISFLCSLVFLINKLYIESALINMITVAVLVIAALKIRLLRVTKRECLFKQEAEASC